MNTGNGARTLAIGVDAAEGALVKRLMDQGAMPSLRSLLGDEASGRWLSVRSPGDAGRSHLCIINPFGPLLAGGYEARYCRRMRRIFLG